jgi:DNA-binding NarL/FixJ family response regulator
LGAVTIRLVLAEDSALLRDGIARLLEGRDEIDLVATCADLPTLLAEIEAHEPDVVLTDIRMPPTQTDEGLQAARHLRTTRPETGVIVLSQYVEPAFALELLGDGAGRRAYLLKERVADVAELVDAIARVAAGGSVVDPKVVDALVSGRGDRTRTTLDRLTPREREVLAEMASGKSNAAIASQLVLSERAVEKHSTNIFSKLDLTEEPDVNRRVMAVLMWFDGDGATAPGPAHRP